MEISNVISILALLMSLISLTQTNKKNKTEALSSFNSAHFDKADIKSFDSLVSNIQSNDCPLNLFRTSLAKIQRDYYSLLAQYNIKTKDNDKINEILNSLSKKNVSQDILSKERSKAKKILKNMYKQ